jgi:hypothetical protein
MMSYHPLDKEKPDPNAISNDDLMAIVGGQTTVEEYKSREWRAEMEKKRRAILADFKAHFETYSTRELLNLHRRGYKGGDVWIRDLGDVCYQDIEHFVREVLATRPHIPNKKEGKALRRKAATAHHGSKKRNQ